MINGYVSNADLNTYNFRNTTATAKTASLTIEEKWPAWKTASFILLTCGLFWASVWYSLQALIF